MDKQNYTIKDVRIQEIKREFSKIQRLVVNEFATEHLIQRRRIIKSYRILFLAAYFYIVDNLSFQRLSDKMTCMYGVSMSDTAWKKQLAKAAPIFASVAMRLTDQRCGETPERFLGYSRAYALDATVIPAQGLSGTVFRLHTQYSLLENTVSAIRITDCHSAESVWHYDITAGALYIADRAYGKTPQLAHLVDEGADFIFRISPQTVRLFGSSSCDTRLDIRALLRESSVSVSCWFKVKKCVYRLRLIAAPIPKEKHAETEKRLRRCASRKQHTLSERTVELNKWIFLATSVGEDVNDAEILEAYRRRWQIELFFKRSKTLLCFHKLRRSTKRYMQTAVLLFTAVVLVLSAVVSALRRHFHVDISDFNLFSVARHIVP